MAGIEENTEVIKRPAGPKVRRLSGRPVNAAFKSPVILRKDLNSDVTSREALLRKIESAKQKCRQLDADIAALKAEGVNGAELDEYINLLHEYNEIKDATQAVLGAIAVLDGVTVRQMHEKYNLDLTD